MGALHRLGLDHDIVVVPELAVMAEAAVAGPRLADDLHGLVEALGGLRDRDAEAVELGLAIALADAEVDAPAAEKIERGDLLGDQHRVVPGQHHDGGAQANVPRARREIGQYRHRGRNLAMAGEMMLHHEELAETQPIGFAHILDETLIALAVLETQAPLGARATEQSELHVWSFNCGRS